MPVLYDGRRFCSDGCGCGCSVILLNLENDRLVIFHPGELEKGQIEFLTWENFQEFLRDSNCFKIDGDDSIKMTLTYLGAEGQIIMTLGEFNKLRSETIGKNPQDIASEAVLIR